MWKSFKSREEKRKILGEGIVIHVDKDESEERRKEKCEKVWKVEKRRERYWDIVLLSMWTKMSQKKEEKKSVKKFEK